MLTNRVTLSKRMRWPNTVATAGWRDMAIFHFNTSLVKRSAGRSVVAVAAWQRGIDLHDERLNRIHACARRGPGWWSAILLPGLADRAWANPERLWNAVEACETRRDSQLARSIKLALPCELAPDRNVALVRGYAQRMFVDDGVVVDVTVRLVNAKGEPQPFASMLMTTRAAVIVEDVSSFGTKIRTWNSRAALMMWRAAWASDVNDSLDSAGCAARVDHRSMVARGLDIEPQIGVGVIAKRRHERGLPSDRVAENEAIVRRRAGKIQSFG
jgi:hypothetical protein